MPTTDIGWAVRSLKNRRTRYDLHVPEVNGVPTILTGWHPTPCDLLAEDWEEVEG